MGLDYDREMVQLVWKNFRFLQRNPPRNRKLQIFPYHAKYQPVFWSLNIFMPALVNIFLFLSEPNTFPTGNDMSNKWHRVAAPATFILLHNFRYEIIRILTTHAIMPLWSVSVRQLSAGFLKKTVYWIDNDQDACHQTVLQSFKMACAPFPTQSMIHS